VICTISSFASGCCAVCGVYQVKPHVTRVETVDPRYGVQTSKPEIFCKVHCRVCQKKTETKGKP
jgi:hypothetical protein